MRKYLLFISFILLSCFSAYSQIFEWVKVDSASGANGIIHDKVGNLYLINSQGLTKYTSAGNRIWQKIISGTDFRIVGIVSDTLGNLYATGAFGGTIVIDTISLSSTAGGNSNMFLVKYNANGIFQWIKRSISNGDSGTDALTIDKQGNPIIIGRFIDSLKLDSFVFDAPLTNQIYLAKYSPSGTCLWAKHMISESFNGGYNGPEIKSDGLGNTYISGHFIGNIQFDSLSYSPTPLTQWIFLTKIDSLGNFLWLKIINGSYDEESGPMDVDSMGNVYMSGSFDAPGANFDSYALPTSSASNFTASYDTDGNFRWAKYGNANMLCAATDGYFVNSPGFITKYDSYGTLQWTKTVSGANNNAMTYIQPSVFITGSYTGSVSFDAFSLSNPIAQLYIAKLSSPLTINIKETESNADFSVYPNPTGRIVTLEISKFNGKFILKLNNSMGKLVYSEELTIASNQFTKQIDLSNLSKGIYFIEMQSEGPQNSAKKQIKKLILQ